MKIKLYVLTFKISVYKHFRMYAIMPQVMVNLPPLLLPTRHKNIMFQIKDLFGIGYLIYRTITHLSVWLMVCLLPLEEQLTRMVQRRALPSTFLIKSGIKLETCHLNHSMLMH